LGYLASHRQLHVTDVEAVQMDSVCESVVLYVHEVDSGVCVCVCVCVCVLILRLQ